MQLLIVVDQPSVPGKEFDVPTPQNSNSVHMPPLASHPSVLPSAFVLLNDGNCKTGLLLPVEVLLRPKGKVRLNAIRPLA